MSRIDLREKKAWLLDVKHLPGGLSKVDFLLNECDIWFYKMQFFSGFTGIRQYEATKALRPDIGWLVIDTGENTTKEDLKQYRYNTPGSKRESLRKVHIPI